MSLGIDDDSIDDSKRDDEYAGPKIARPQAASGGMPPLALRGLNPPSMSASASAPAGELGAPTGAPAATPATAPAIRPAPIAKPTAPKAPTALDTRTSGDEAELGRLQSTGSGISQIHNRVGRGVLRGLETVGDILMPAATMMIPGTELHHTMLEHQQRGRIGEDIKEQGEQATATKTEADTREADARTGLTDAQTKALGEPKPKEEKWDEFKGFTDTDGTPLQREENSGQVVRADNKKPPSGFVAEKQPAEKSGIKVTRVVKGVPHEVLVDPVTGADIKDEGQTKIPGESPDQKRNAAESAQVERESRGAIRKAGESYRATQRSVGQLTASIDQAADGNGLLTSFVPTMEVLGINSANGVHRISPAEAQAAGLPGGWVERFNAWFDKAATGKISPELKTEGKQLANILLNSAYQNYKSIYDDESGVVEGYGGKDFQKRVPLIPQGDIAAGQGGGGQGGATPAGAVSIGTSSLDGKQYYLDAHGKKLGPVAP